MTAAVAASDGADGGGGRGWLRCLSPPCRRRRAVPSRRGSRAMLLPPSCSPGGDLSRGRERWGGTIGGGVVGPPNSLAERFSKFGQ